MHTPTPDYSHNWFRTKKEISKDKKREAKMKRTYSFNQSEKWHR